MSDTLKASRDEHGRVLCCHGRPFTCNECGEDYAADLDRAHSGGVETDVEVFRQAIRWFVEQASVAGYSIDSVRNNESLKEKYTLVLHRAANQLAARTPPPPPARGWQPIEGAPNGMPVLLWKESTKEHYVAARISGGYGLGWCTPDGHEVFRATHWMPLPDPPSADRQEP